ncbi:MAG: ABC transporter ATP-binding protein [Planctomycetaceae bacterium]|nr:ABC transporter ATP-binding protein [Planctomycetaceae bacterium]
MNSAIIETHALKKQFDRKSVLSGIDLSIEAGQVVGLLGTNGSGKTTFIKCLLGLLHPTSGTSAVFGETSWDLSASAKSRLGYVSQEFAMLPWMSVRSMTDYTGAFYENWDKSYVDLLIKEWNLDEKSRVGTLSVGQRQKLAVILALGHHPELLILDEPVASLDPIARRQFLKSLIEFTEEEENTILFSTHITSDLERVASHVVFLEEGTVGFNEELDELKDRVKRVRISGVQNLREKLNIPGTIRAEYHETHALLTVKEFQAPQWDSLAAEINAVITVEDLNLEEIFLELSEVSSASPQQVIA